MSGPLESVRVVELAGIGPISLAATLLADLGADVIRVVRPGDPADHDGPDGLGRDRRVLELDLKRDPGSLLDVLDAADILVEGFRPGVLERLGLGPDVCLGRNPSLVYARMTGWGQTGPLAPRAGHDINYIALTGVLHGIGPPDGAPVPPLNLVGDFGGGTMFLVCGVLAALTERARTGRGQVVDAAMVDGAAYLMTMAYRMFNAGSHFDARGSNLVDGGTPWYAVYECADGRYVAVGALERPFFDALLSGLGITEPFKRGDRSRWPVLRQRIAAAFRTRTRDEWAAAFEATDACVTPVLTLAEASSHPHLASRDTFAAGPQGPEPAPAPRFSTHPQGRKHPR